MNFEVIRKSDIKVTQWSGGTTSELFIFPRSADFKLGTFDVRISIATVETEESLFTPLPGVSRTLMVLSGELTLEHGKHHSTHLKTLEQDSFSGDWSTCSFGKATDFNVMTKNDKCATVEAINLNSGDIISDFKTNTIDFIYVLEGELIFNLTSLKSGESIALYKTLEKEKRIVKALDRVVLIRVKMN